MPHGGNRKSTLSWLISRSSALIISSELLRSSYSITSIGTFLPPEHDAAGRVHVLDPELVGVEQRDGGAADVGPGLGDRPADLQRLLGLDRSCRKSEPDRTRQCGSYPGLAMSSHRRLPYRPPGRAAFAAPFPVLGNRPLSSTAWNPATGPTVRCDDENLTKNVAPAKRSAARAVCLAAAVVPAKRAHASASRDP